MKSSQGFTLIEMMITVAIIGILAAVAYPTYDEHVKRGNRSEGMALLNDAAARQERYFAQNNVYITATTDADIAKLGISKKSPTSKYTLSLGSVANDGGYTLTVTPTLSDPKCGNLVFNAIGNRGAATKMDTGNAADKEKVSQCWR